MDIFEGFGKTVNTDQETARKTAPAPQPPVQSAPNTPERSTTQSTKTDPTLQPEYQKYVDGLASYVDLTEEMHAAEQKLRDAESEVAKKDSRIQLAVKTFSQLQRDLKAALSKMEQERRGLAQELELQKTDPQNASIKFTRPPVDGSAAQFLRTAFDRRLLTKLQRDKAVQPVETVCGPNGEISSIQHVSSLENGLAASTLYQQLVNCIPTDKFMKKMTNIVTLSAAGLFFLFVLLGGFGIGFISSILSLMSWIVLFPIIGFVAYFFISAIVEGIIHSKSTDNTISLPSKIIAAIVGFGILAPSVTGALVGGVMNLVESQSFIVRAVVGLVFAGIAYGISYFIFTRKFVLNTMRKIPVMKTMMLKKVFAEGDAGADFVNGVYCFLNHDAICNYFEANHISATISMLESSIRDSDRKIAEQKARIEETTKRNESSMSVLERGKKESLSEANEATRVMRNCQQALADCVDGIREWGSRSGVCPDPNWITDNWFGENVCFLDTRDSDNFSIVKYGAQGGICVAYDVGGGDSLDALSRTLSRIISAFDHIAPERLIDYAVVDLNGGEGGELLGYDLDWRYAASNSSGGVGKRTKGRVSLISGRSDMMEYEGALRKYRQEKVDFMNNSRDQISRKKQSGERTVMRHINAVRRDDPFKYQVVMIVPRRASENMGGMDSNFSDFRAMYGTLQNLADSVIPVFVVEKGKAVHENWKQLVDDATVRVEFVG